ncbi:hypothetical protein [Brevundimonas sp.]|uniref:hypothetical protein n=1 Tax=Brevundimonas sp. TaxID=1871086 RepID=UPI003F72B260
MANQKYPVLPVELANQLSSIEATDGLYHPCMVTLRDGTSVDCVYLANAHAWFRIWGIWPEDDRGKQALDVRAVASISDSPSRLPALFANRLYAEGESGMGYTIFTVKFRDGTSVVVGTGNAIDFIDYPPGQTKDTVVDVLPHIGRDAPEIRTAPRYYWCLYDGVGTAI